MKLSTRSRYGARMMIALARKQGKKPVFLREIAREEGISEKYLSQLAMALKAKGYLATYRGAHGGYVLKKKPSDITLRNVVEALEGGANVVECAADNGVCERSPDCVIRGVWCRLAELINVYLESYTLLDLVNMIKRRDDEAVNYII